MAAELIGRCLCPLCRSDKARLSLAKTGLPVMTCNACNLQTFARSDRSDLLLRALLVAEPKEAPAPDPAPTPKTAPTAAAAQVPAPTPTTTPAQPIGWGILR